MNWYLLLYLDKFVFLEFMILNTSSCVTTLKSFGYECGFETPSYYTQLFKRYYNCTPTEFRNSQKKRA